MFGGNDDQNMPAFSGAPQARAGSPQWIDQYRRRVADTMDLLKSPQNDRLVLWPGIPVTRPGTVPNVNAMNAVYASEAASRPWVRYFDSYAFLADQYGRFSPTLPNADGRTRDMRSADGIHLTGSGSNRLAQAIYARLGTLVDLAASPLVPDPGQSAPPNVAERPTDAVVSAR
jgi:hypothetical protein